MDLDVIIASRDYGRFLAQAIDSALAQTDANVLVTVVDDGSTDNTRDVLAAYDCAVQALRFEHSRGIAAARNAGLRMTRRPFVAFLDADDVLPADRTQGLGDVLLACDADYSFGVSRTFEHPNSPGEGPTRIIPGPAPGSTLFRREAFERVGPFDEDIAHMSLVSWFLRARQAGLTPSETREIVVERRLHDANVSRRDRKRLEALALVRRHLASAEF